MCVPVAINPTRARTNTLKLRQSTQTLYLRHIHARDLCYNPICQAFHIPRHAPHKSPYYYINLAKKGRAYHEKPSLITRANICSFSRVAASRYLIQFHFPPPTTTTTRPAAAQRKLTRRRARAGGIDGPKTRSHVYIYTGESRKLPPEWRLRDNF